jgi:putative oxidoreductase
MDFNSIYQYAGWGTTSLEWVLGIVFVVHGWAKVRNPIGVGKILGGGKNTGLIFGLVEVVAGVMIATGMGTFVSSIAIILIMLGAMYFKIFKWKIPFTTDTNTGWEYDLVLLAAALTLLIG